MKYHDDFVNYEKKKEQDWNKEHKAGGFKCSHCKKWVVINGYMGTINRNHCNICLWSRHVDEQKGDRKATCLGGMRPVGLTFKHEGIGKQGELMIVHQCAGCERVSINRIAGDDENGMILQIFEESLSKTDIRTMLMRQNITLLMDKDKNTINTMLFGNR